MSNIGLILSALGSFLAAISIGPTKNGGIEVAGKRLVALNKPRLFQFGLFLLILGSLFQLKIN